MAAQVRELTFQLHTGHQMQQLRLSPHSLSLGGCRAGLLSPALPKPQAEKSMEENRCWLFMLNGEKMRGNFYFDLVETLRVLVRHVCGGGGVRGVCVHMHAQG